MNLEKFNSVQFTVASFSILARFTTYFPLVFVLAQEKAFSWSFNFKANRSRILMPTEGFSKKTAPGIFKTALRLRDWHVFMWQSLEILNVFNTSDLKHVFWKTKALFKKLKVLRLKTRHFHTKLICKSMLRQTEWEIQNGLVTKNGVLLVTTLFFLNLCFSLRTSYKKLIWCTNHPNVHIYTFWKRSSFIWGCSFPVSILSISFRIGGFNMTLLNEKHNMGWKIKKT